MTPARGQILRRVGLSIEAACMLGLLGLARGKVDVWRGMPVEPITLLRVGLGLGALIWLYGTVAVIKGRRASGD